VNQTETRESTIRGKLSNVHDRVGFAAMAYPSAAPYWDQYRPKRKRSNLVFCRTNEQLVGKSKDAERTQSWWERLTRLDSYTPLVLVRHRKDGDEARRMDVVVAEDAVGIQGTSAPVAELGQEAGAGIDRCSSSYRRQADLGSWSSP
jgi:hypothetical protein